MTPTKTTVLKLGVPRLLRISDEPARVEQLQRKLDEYRRRDTEEAVYKAVILDRLLRGKELKVADLSAQVEGRLGARFNRVLFNECCNVIDDYCRTGGVKTVLGSGLGC
jgi:hypothetical protein